MTYFSFILLFVLGLVFGSFLNALVWRLNQNKSIWGPHSVCPKCNHNLAARDLAPVVSFLFLRGRCRYCREKISIQYPLVEVILGLLFILLFWRFGWSAALLLNLFLLVVWVKIFLFDLKYQLVVENVVWPTVVVALVGNVLLGVAWWSIVFAMAIGAAFFGLQYIISHGKWLGAGDISLGVLMGASLGWPNLLAALMVAYIFGSLVSLILLASKKKGLKSELPLGVFLAVGVVVALIWGGSLSAWYLNLVF